MRDRFGMVQFASGAKPDLTHGYCLDDNARAFLVALLVRHLDSANADARTIGTASLSFMEACRRSDGRFHNLMGADGNFTDEVGSQDSLGRLIWACGVGARSATNPRWRASSEALLRTALQRLGDLTELRPLAYTALGCAAALAPQTASSIPATISDALPRALEDATRTALEHSCATLLRALDGNADGDWQWFEPMLSWGNARLPEALLRGAIALREEHMAEAGLRSLSFLAHITQPDDRFVPIGNRGWYERGKERAIYDQQPIEACTMVDLWLAAARLTDKLEYESKALTAFSWFLGLNTNRVALVEPDSGGCRDGLEQTRINQNMGAESTLSYLHAHAAISAHLRAKTR
jgi:hypothetical protein